MHKEFFRSIPRVHYLGIRHLASAAVRVIRNSSFSRNQSGRRPTGRHPVACPPHPLRACSTACLPASLPTGLPARLPPGILGTRSPVPVRLSS